MMSWIFQGNPKVFRVDEYLRNQKIIMWTVRQKYFKDIISINDIVFIWRSDGNIPKSGGIIAKGRIISFPQEMEDDAPHLWIEQQEDTFALRVKIEIEDVRLNELEGMLNRIDLEKDDNVKDMRILSYRAETNYQLKPKHGKYIEYLWEHQKKK